MHPSQQTGDRPLVSVAEAAILAGLSKSVAYRLAAAGVLPGLVRLPGARLLVRRRVLEAWLAGSESTEARESAPQELPPTARSAVATASIDGALDLSTARWKRGG